MASDSDKRSLDRPDDYEDLLDDALADFASTSATQESKVDVVTAKGGLPASDMLPQDSSRKSSAKGKQFDPLPARTRPKKVKQRDKPAHDAQQSTKPQGADNIEQDFARLMQELDPAGAQTDSTQSQGISDTLRQMMQQSEGLNSPRQRGSHSDSLSEPMLAGLQEQFQGGEGGFGSLADTLMRQLLAKNVLYQPMKDIGERYPEWLAAHRDVITSAEIGQYEEQHKQIKRILHIYETDPENFTELFEALQQMQACGQPPQDIVNDLAPGMAFDEEGLPKSFLGGTQGHPPGCCIQ